VALVPQGRRIFSPLSVRENLLLGARAAGWTLERVFALFPPLRERAEQSGGTLSGGEQQMLAIGRALLTNGRLLLLDEPSEGLAPIIVREIGRIVKGLKGERLSILLVEQNYHLALRVADRVYVMNKGQIVYHGSPAELDANEEIKRRFLGVS
jgi:branched-chain amino acid transport system ATP-binding protein